MPLSVPAPTPGQFVAVPDVAEGACVIGDPIWTRDGSLRWFGGTAESLDFTPEAAALPPPRRPRARRRPRSRARARSPPGPASRPLPLSRRLPLPTWSPIAGRFCVDRFEASLVDARTGAALSPDYPPTPGLLDFVLAEWSTGRERTGNVHARAFPLPWMSPSRVGDRPEPLAVARLGVRPNGYVTGVVAEAACAAAGKRLCTLDEFVTACRGQDDTLFPYGDTYEDGRLQRLPRGSPRRHPPRQRLHRPPRPAPRPRDLPRAAPSSSETGESPACRSRWGDDAIYDMVGNLDEWVDDGAGAFAGGFYSRSTRSGCEALVTAHPKRYLDYSTGVRCCRDALTRQPGPGA